MKRYCTCQRKTSSLVTEKRMDSERIEFEWLKSRRETINNLWNAHQINFLLLDTLSTYLIHRLHPVSSPNIMDPYLWPAINLSNILLVRSWPGQDILIVVHVTRWPQRKREKRGKRDAIILHLLLPADQSEECCPLITHFLIKGILLNCF